METIGMIFPATGLVSLFYMLPNYGWRENCATVLFLHFLVEEKKLYPYYNNFYASIIIIRFVIDKKTIIIISQAL